MRRDRLLVACAALLFTGAALAAEVTFAGAVTTNAREPEGLAPPAK